MSHLTADAETIDTLLRTKLHRPEVSSDFVPRPELVARLNLAFKRKLVLVSAPAGFGKSTLVSAWLGQCKSPFAWLSLDEGDNDLNRFLGYLVAAIQTAFPRWNPRMRALLRSPQSPPADVLATTLINDIADAPRDFILVLDDYHLIHDPSIHDAMNRLIRYQPSVLRLVLTTRTDPPFPLASLRARQTAHLEIRSHDLSFSTDEIKTFFKQAADMTLEDKTARMLKEQTEGWAAGLRMAAVSMHGNDQPEAFLGAFKGTHRLVTDYLLEEVLSRQPQSIRDFLLQSSILDRFCAPLCDSVTDDAGPGEGGQALLESFERTNLFVVPLDNERRWYRYHHLFQDLLRHKLTVEYGRARIAALHARAGAWFAANGFVEEAISHALAAGDVIGAARIVEQNIHLVLNRQDRRTLERWIGLLPEAVVEERPALILAQAWILHLQTKYSSIHSLLRRAEEVLDAQARIIGDVATVQPTQRALRGEIAVLRSQSYCLRGYFDESIEQAEQALDALPVACQLARGLATMYWSMAHQANGHWQTAERALHEALFDSRDSPDSNLTFRSYVLFTLTLYHLNRGDLDRCRDAATNFLEWTTRHGLTIGAAWAHYFLGLANYEQNRLEAATQHFAVVAEQRYSAHLGAVWSGMRGLAYAYQAQGLSDQANGVIQTMMQADVEASGAVDDSTWLTQAHLAHMQGDAERAAHWTPTAELLTYVSPVHMGEKHVLTQMYLLVAQKKLDNFQAATETLHALHQKAKRIHSISWLIDILALQALTLDAQGKEREALDALEQAVTLARPGGWIRPFADLGPDMGRLLRLLAERGVAPGYLDEVLAAFPAARSADAGAQAGATAREAMTFTPLTWRESEVLAVLAQHRSDKEIAEALVLSPLTVKTHLKNIYHKLGVGSRQEAVTKANTLGILASMPSTPSAPPIR